MGIVSGIDGSATDHVPLPMTTVAPGHDRVGPLFPVLLVSLTQ
jgi:hypothetical protein